MITEEEARKFANLIYRGTTYSHKMKFVAFNDKYVLVQKPPSTEYVGRVSGSVYSESEWYLVGYDANKSTISHSPSEVAAFSKVGKLSIEDKQLLKEKFGIEIPKKERNKRIAEEEYVIMFDPNDYWQGYRDNCFRMYKLLINTKDTITVYDDVRKEESVRSKRKYRILYYKDGSKALNDLLKLERLAKESNMLRYESNKKADDINAIFENKTDN
jgi:hypothetical protein